MQVILGIIGLGTIVEMVIIPVQFAQIKEKVDKLK
jgi:hypothetical protein